jgi:hypothetical protein
MAGSNSVQRAAAMVFAMIAEGSVMLFPRVLPFLAGACVCAFCILAAQIATPQVSPAGASAIAPATVLAKGDRQPLRDATIHAMPNGQ